MQSKFVKYFKERIAHERKLNHLGNNLLFKISTSRGEYLLKQYSTVQKDNWDRGKTEFRALNYLWERGFREIPKPFSFHEPNIGIYSFEKGRNLDPLKIKEKNILAASNFLAKLHELDVVDKEVFPKERTSCFCLNDYLNLIDTRVNSLFEDFAGGYDAKVFLRDTLIPHISNLKENFRKRDDLHKTLTLEEQVITPGDFGFHNLLVDEDKHIFLDFEYCGRDDPVKQILDFFHHDRTRAISNGLKNYFLDNYKKIRGTDSSFDERLHTIDPLIGMNWALIYLNPLSKNYQKHLEFSQNGLYIENLIHERIQKSQTKLKSLCYFDT